MTLACEHRQAQTADYIQTMLLELRALAQRADLDFLTYALEIALIEASDLAAGKAPERMPALGPKTQRPRTPSPEEIVRQVLLMK